MGHLLSMSILTFMIFALLPLVASRPLIATSTAESQHPDVDTSSDVEIASRSSVPRTKAPLKSYETITPINERQSPAESCQLALDSEINETYRITIEDNKCLKFRDNYDTEDSDSNALDIKETRDLLETVQVNKMSSNIFEGMGKRGPSLEAVGGLQPFGDTTNLETGSLSSRTSRDEESDSPLSAEANEEKQQSLTNGINEPDFVDSAGARPALNGLADLSSQMAYPAWE